MEVEGIKVLLIEDNPGDARLVREGLAQARGAKFELEWAERLETGLGLLAEGGFDVVLSDLGLPDSQGLDTLARVRAQAPGVPVVVLTGSHDVELGVRAVQEGAQDYLVKGQLDSNLLTRSLRYAIERQRVLAEVEERQALEKVRRAMQGTIEALAFAAEMRDPYTAGHQRRVARLASALAGELGLSENEVEGIFLTGVIHDIGKIHIPAEILSKPGPISETEFDLIKTHPLVGYDILKLIEFPWPIAQVVLQHHERIDGSGYPAGLAGEDILPGARILGVADVVEAMSSHRPYRPAFGIEKSLEEISQNSGVLYDPPVVDACLRLLAEERFKFE